MDIEKELSIGEVLISKDQNDINAFNYMPMKEGDRVIAFFDEMASYEIALPKAPIVQAMVEKYKQVAGIYTESIDGKSRRWQIAAFKEDGFRVHVRHCSQGGGLTFVFDDCVLFLLAERDASGYIRQYFWTFEDGIIEKTIAAKNTSNEILLSQTSLKFADHIERKILKAIKGEA